MGLVKNERNLLDHGTLKLDVSHKQCDELSKFIERFLLGDSDGIIFHLTANLLYIFDI